MSTEMFGNYRTLLVCFGMGYVNVLNRYARQLDLKHHLSGILLGVWVQGLENEFIVFSEVYTLPQTRCNPPGNPATITASQK